MTFQIRHDGRTFTVHTVVGDGLTKVLFDEEEQPLARDGHTDAAGAATDHFTTTKETA